MGYSWVIDRCTTSSTQQQAKLAPPPLLTFKVRQNLSKATGLERSQVSAAAKTKRMHHHHKQEKDECKSKEAKRKLAKVIEKEAWVQKVAVVQKIKVQTVPWLGRECPNCAHAC